MFKIGTLADWFGVGLLEGIRESQNCGATGVQVYAWGELDPRKADSSLIQSVISTAKECSQTIVALCGELGGHGMETVEEHATKIEYLRSVVDLAVRLDCCIVTTHVGIIPEDKDGDIYKAMQDAMRTAGDYAAKNGVTIAIETGPELIATLKSFVDSCPGVGINYDPANIVMVTGDDEVKGVFTADASIVHTHAKDGVMYKYMGPKEAYGLFAKGGIESMQVASEYMSEKPLGRGAYVGTNTSVHFATLDTTDISP